MTKPLLINGILGNSRLLATLTADGELQRVFWPHVDGGQHVERILGGVALGGNPVIWQNDNAWSVHQAYERDQNVLVTEASLPAGLTVRCVDAAALGRDLVVRQLTFTNRSSEPIDLAYVQYQWIRIDENPLYNTVLYDEAGDSLIHYRRDVFVASGADRVLSAVAVGRPAEVLAQAAAGCYCGAGVLHGDVAAAGRWELGSLAPGESTALTLYWALGNSSARIRELLNEARAQGSESLLSGIRQYWREWLNRARPLAVPQRTAHAGPRRPGLPVEPAPADQIEELYHRSLLVFKLMSDEQTGAVIAAPEFDPAFAHSGGYAYCWGRDAAYITVAMDLAGYHELAAAFYRWSVGTQEPEGWWMHRHYASGHWGPSWGLIQIDETGSILYGMALHARLHGGEPFARSVWPSVARAADWLLQNMDPQTGLPFPAVDLWEERTAELSYSSAAVYAGLRAAAELAQLVGDSERSDRCREAAALLQAAILRECVREGYFLRGRFLELSEERYKQLRETGTAVRHRTGSKGRPIYEAEEDHVPDASLLGMSYPFGVVEPTADVMRRTADRLERALWTPGAGGMRRYVDDEYRGGGNPWVLCTLWLGLYEAEIGREENARQLLDWAVRRRSQAGLLSEQVDPQTGDPVWVLPLTWSHAMYVLLALRLYRA